ncbi:M23 family metallopeptidase [Plantibacter sp. T3]|uniref:M23 family metallopeptidase n=1 Tax=Plantibacter sp. T3 TaxID=2653161 RepID=UPI0012F2A8D9|nr:M23 family metallopeptidase [Plantibacter sp. T3]VXB02746.1 Peptidase family M23 [Plantibacter sp. T3]
MGLKYQYPYDLSHYDSSDGYNAPRAGGSNHRGADFNGFPERTPIPAVAAGTVVENYRSGGLGWLVVLAHPDGVFSGYCHMYQQSPLAVGTAVTRGQILGGIGNTGEYSEGAHLHLTIGLNQSGATGGGSHWIDHTDPITYIRDRLNGDDPTTTPQEEEEDMTAGTFIKRQGGAAVYWQEHPLAPLYPLNIGQYKAYAAQGLKTNDLTPADFDPIIQRVGQYNLDAQQRRIPAGPNDPKYDGWQLYLPNRPL